MTNTTEYERATIMGTYQMYSSGGVSGDYRGVQVNASGQIILASGVYISSGSFVVVQSGLGVSISGQHVYVESGVYIASGVYLASGISITLASGLNVVTTVLSGSVAAIPFTTEIAKGHVSGTTVWSKIGFNGGIGTTEEDMIGQGGVYVFPSSGIQMMIKSTATGDRGGAPVGSGALSVTLYYLDSGYFTRNETITLLGTSGNNTVATDVLRVQNMRVASVGGNAMPIGNLSLTDLSGTLVYGYISSGQTRMRQCVWTVPASGTLYITGYNVSTNTVKEKYTKFTTRANYDDKAMAKTSGFFIPYNEIITVDTPFVQVVDPPTRIGQTTDLKVSVVAEAAGTATCALRGWLE